jgi:hypothetical protein
VHLGFAKDATGDKGEPTKTVKQETSPKDKSSTVDRTKDAKKPSTPPADVTTTSKKIAVPKEVTKSEEEDDEEEIPGHVKSFDLAKRTLVLTLANGKSRSFLLAKDVPVHIKGASAASAQGIKDPQLKEGAYVTVITDDGGRKVKELKVIPASEVKRRKAG